MPGIWFYSLPVPDLNATHPIVPCEQQMVNIILQSDQTNILYTSSCYSDASPSHQVATVLPSLFLFILLHTLHYYIRPPL